MASRMGGCLELPACVRLDGACCLRLNLLRPIQSSACHSQTRNNLSTSHRTEHARGTWMRTSSKSFSAQNLSQAWRSSTKHKMTWGRSRGQRTCCELLRGASWGRKATCSVQQEPSTSRSCMHESGSLPQHPKQHPWWRRAPTEGHQNRWFRKSRMSSLWEPELVIGNHILHSQVNLLAFQMVDHAKLWEHTAAEQKRQWMRDTPKRNCSFSSITSTGIPNPSGRTSVFSSCDLLGSGRSGRPGHSGSLRQWPFLLHFLKPGSRLPFQLLLISATPFHRQNGTWTWRPGSRPCMLQATDASTHRLTVLHRDLQSSARHHLLHQTQSSWHCLPQRAWWFWVSPFSQNCSSLFARLCRGSRQFAGATWVVLVAIWAKQTHLLGLSQPQLVHVQPCLHQLRQFAIKFFQVHPRVAQTPNWTLALIAHAVSGVVWTARSWHWRPSWPRCPWTWSSPNLKSRPHLQGVPTCPLTTPLQQSKARVQGQCLVFLSHLGAFEPSMHLPHVRPCRTPDLMLCIACNLKNGQTSDMPAEAEWTPWESRHCCPNERPLSANVVSSTFAGADIQAFAG